MTEDTDRALARFRFDLAHALATHPHEAGFSEEELAERAGLSVDEIRMIEEGDSSSLPDIIRLCNALNARLTLNRDFTFALACPSPNTLRHAAAG